MYETAIPTLMQEFDKFGIKTHQMPNAVGMWPNERECLLWSALNSPEGKWMEIGSFCGGSAVLLCLARRFLAKSKGEDSIPLDQSIVSVDYNFNPMFDVNVYNTGGFVKESRKIECDSIELDKHYEGDPLSFVFIDGYHSFKYAFNDFSLVDPWLVPGGMVAFHDVSPMMHAPEQSFNKYIDKIYKEVLETPSGKLLGDKEDFLLDQAVAYILKHTDKYERVEIPVRRHVAHFRETGLKRWVRGKTSPFNSLMVIRKKP